MKPKQNLAPLALVLLSVLCATCGSPVSESEETDPITDQQYEFNLTAGKPKILAITNMARTATDIGFQFYSAGSPRNVSAPVRSLASMRSSVPLSGPIVLKDLESASRFNANPPPFSRDTSRGIVRPAAQSYVMGSSKYFWLEYSTNHYKQDRVTVRATGAYCNIWVVDENYDNSSTEQNDNKITSSQAQALAATFDRIYPLATEFLDYEYGGGANGDGGMDRDKKIQILVYDIDFDHDPGENQEYGVAGFFHGKDEYYQHDLDAEGYSDLKSNVAEMFYLDAHFTDHEQEFIYSTLIHEFQHMINFNQKAVNRNLVSDTWYNEMLSLLAEDVIGPSIGIDKNKDGHPINSRIPAFLDYYNYAGIDTWLSGDDASLSYSIAYAFGAYLIRNYGGPKLIQNMMSNNAVDHASVTQALKVYDETLSFRRALERYAEALVYSGSHGGISGKKTFDTTAQDGVYRADAFDIWTIDAYPDPEKVRYGPIIFTVEGSPITLNARYQGKYRSSSVELYRIPDSWTGTVRLSVSPSNTDVRLTILEY